MAQYVEFHAFYLRTGTNEDPSPRCSRARTTPGDSRRSRRESVRSSERPSAIRVVTHPGRGEFHPRAAPELGAQLVGDPHSYWAPRIGEKHVKPENPPPALRRHSPEKRHRRCSVSARM